MNMWNQRVNRGPIAWMARNSVAANLLMVILLAGGLISILFIRQEVFPSVELDQVTVSIPYPGASPAEVEQGVILAVEEAVRGLDGVKEVISTAHEHLGQVQVEMQLYVDRQRLYQDVQQAVDRITSFPQEAEEPQVFLDDQKQQVISLVLAGPADEWVLREWAETIRDRLLQDQEIANLSLAAIRPYELSIEVSQHTLQKYGLTLEDIATRIRNAAIELPAGSIRTEAGDILVRFNDRREFGDAFATIPIISSSDGTVLHLDQVAHIRDRFEDIHHFAKFNDHPAIRIDVFRVGAQTPVQVSKRVRELSRELKASLPAGLTLSILNDRAEQYRDSVGVIVRNGAMGLVLVFLLLGLFLNPRLAFWVGMGIPTSFLGAMLFLQGWDMSINTVSLFRFLIAIGIVVDDAIVVSENIHERQGRIHHSLRAAIYGTHQVAVSVTFSVLTNIVAFLPFFFVPGFLGKLLRMIPAVVVLVLAFSLVESFFILPAHLGHAAKPRSQGWFAKQQSRFSDWTKQAIETYISPILAGAIRFRYLTLASALALLLLATGYLASGRMGLSLGPDTEESIAVAELVLPLGTQVAVTQAHEQRLLQAAKQIIAEHGDTALAKGIYSEIGGLQNGVASGGHQVSVSVYLTAPRSRPMSTQTFCALWREQVGDISGAESLVYLDNDQGPTGGGPGISVELNHVDGELLSRAATDLAQAMRGLSFVTELNDGIRPGKRQRDFQLRDGAHSLALTSQEVAQQVRAAFYGVEALRQQRGRHEVKVMVRLPHAERQSEADLENLLIRSPSGRYVPLRELADMTSGQAFTEINRHDGRRIITVSCDVAPEDKAGQVQRELRDKLLPELQSRYPGLDVTFGGEQRELAESLSSLGMGLALALIAIYSLMAIPFRSYLQPAIIMTSIPFGLIGALAGHLLMGYRLSFVSIMGMVALVGVIVNNGLVLISFANQSLAAGVSPFQAIHRAAVRRFRPIFLTSLTTFGGLAPMIFERSEQAQLMIPIAISLGYGVLFATVTTMLTVPALYLVVEDIRRWSTKPRIG